MLIVFYSNSRRQNAMTVILDRYFCHFATNSVAFLCREVPHDVWRPNLMLRYSFKISTIVLDSTLTVHQITILEAQFPLWFSLYIRSDVIVGFVIRCKNTEKAVRSEISTKKDWRQANSILIESKRWFDCFFFWALLLSVHVKHILIAVRTDIGWRV